MASTQSKRFTIPENGIKASVSTNGYFKNMMGGSKLTPVQSKKEPEHNSFDNEEDWYFSISLSVV